MSFRKPHPPPPPFLSTSPTDRWDGRSLFTATSSKTVFGRERGRMEVGSEGRIQDVVLCFGSCSHAFSLLVPRCRCTSSPPDPHRHKHTHTPSPAPCFFDHISLFLLSVAAHRGFQQEVLISFLLPSCNRIKIHSCPSCPWPAAEPRGSALFLRRAHHEARAKHVCRA